MNDIEAVNLLVSDTDDAEAFDEIEALQQLINSGTVWRMEGSLGRAAMSALKSGQCVLPSCWKDNVDRPLTPATVAQFANQLKPAITDAYGTVVPYREMLKPGTVGTLDYADAQQERN